MAQHLPLRTDRLLLRPVTHADLAGLFVILGDAAVMKLALYARPLSRQDALEFIDSAFAKTPEDVTHLGVLCRNDHPAIVGFAGLLPCKYFPDDLEFGFVLAKEHQRKGYATEIGKKLIDIGLGALGRDRLLALCHPQNRASRGVLEKLGMSSIETIATPDRGARMVFVITKRIA